MLWGVRGEAGRFEAVEQRWLVESAICKWNIRNICTTAAVEGIGQWERHVESVAERVVEGLPKREMGWEH